jgi:hypothetical protein
MAGFYSHGIITQGYTNRGQWLGAGIGQGGNSQYLGYQLYFPRGSARLFFQRQNPDLDYTFSIDRFNNQYDWFLTMYNVRAFLDFGLSGAFFITKNIALTLDMVYRDEHNPMNLSAEAVKPDLSNDLAARKSVHRYNFYGAFGVKFVW